MTMLTDAGMGHYEGGFCQFEQDMIEPAVCCYLGIPFIMPTDWLQQQRGPERLLSSPAHLRMPNCHMASSHASKA